MNLSLQSRIFCFFSFSCGRLGVPLFLMITGGLLLSKDFDTVRTQTFWKKRWGHLLVCTLIWLVIYDIFIVLRQPSQIRKLQFLEEIIFFRKSNMNHAWYMPMILGLYILIPFVSFVLKNYDTWLFVFPLTIYTIYSFGFATINIIYRVYHPELPLSNQFSLGFSGGIYGLYILYGYFIKEGAFKRIKTICVISVAAAAFAAAVYIQLWSYKNGSGYNIWYDNFFLLVASMCLFELCSRIRVPMGHLIQKVSYYSFALYLTHNMIKICFSGVIKSTSFEAPVQVFMLWAICFTVSFVISVLISKIPRFGKYILYLK